MRNLAPITASVQGTISTTTAYRFDMSLSQQSFLDPASAGNNLKQKAETARIAKEQEKAIHEKLTRNNDPIPKYDFLELIGKGAYGRVFKAFDQANNRVVALKVIDVDSHDYKINALAKDDSIEVTLHEIKVLKQLKDSHTKNVNVIFDAFQIHSQLWIVNEYCPGGSVRTLMRATSDKLDEKYIVPIARELAIALKAIHEEGIIHRDVKGANVMIHEEGKLQVIDFGVAGVLQTNIDKRSTVIGTPHWMAPEMHKLAPQGGLNYGTEVDVWAYGCTLYEIATGTPPYPKTQPGRMLGATLGRKPPRLEKPQFSEGLVDLVAFVLESKPADRPSMEQVLKHPYIKDSEERHPTALLAELVKIYYRWEHSGGQRQSLFINAGAAAAEFPPTLHEEDDWNFSTTANFEQELENYSFDPDPVKDAPKTHPGDVLGAPPSIVVPGIHSKDPAETSSQNSEHRTPTGDRTLLAKLNTEERVKRGEQALIGLFNEKKPPYEYKVKTDFVEQKAVPTAGKPLPRTRSDLPLRDESVQSSVYRKEIDTEHLRSASFDTTPNIDLANVGTIKANRMNRFLDNMGHDDKSESSSFYDHAEKRATKEWTFPQALHGGSSDTGSELPSIAFGPKRATIEWGFPPEMPAIGKEPQRKEPQSTFKRPGLKHVATAPPGQVRQSMGGMIDLDALYDSELYDSDIPPTAPVSDDEAFSGVTSEDEGMSRSASNEGQSAQKIRDDDKTLLPAISVPSKRMSVPGKGIPDHPNISASSGPAEIGKDYDPFLFEDSSDDEIRAEVNARLNKDGVTDPADRASARRSYIRLRKASLGYLKKDVDDSGYAQFRKRRLATAVGDYPESLFSSDPKNLTCSRLEATYLWEQHENLASDPKPYASAPSNGIPNKSPAISTGSMQGFETVTAFTAAAAAFPPLVPPNAESLLADAPASTLDGELKRLTTDWICGLGVLGDIFEGSLKKEQQVRRNNNRGVATEAEPGKNENG